MVHVQVKPEHVNDFIEAIKKNAAGSVEEPGNRRFDVLQSLDDPCAFVLNEVFVDKESAAAHKETEHYLTWRERVADWMAVPREGKGYQQLFPE